MSANQVELLIFEVNGHRYGADAGEVLRIDRPGAARDVGLPLGAPRTSAKTLVFRGDDGHEKSLRVDAVHGVQTVDASALRRLPPMMNTNSAHCIGAWLDGATTVVLVSLSSMAAGA